MQLCLLELPAPRSLSSVSAVLTGQSGLLEFRSTCTHFFYTNTVLLRPFAAKMTRLVSDPNPSHLHFESDENFLDGVIAIGCTPININL